MADWSGKADDITVAAGFVVEESGDSGPEVAKHLAGTELSSFHKLRELEADIWHYIGRTCKRYSNDRNRII